MACKRIFSILRRASWAAVCLGLAGSAAVPALRAQEKPAKPEPDVLIFSDGERLIGHLVRSSGKSITFHSDMAGDVTVDWSKIQELHTSKPYAVIRKNVQFHKGENPEQIPQGTLSATDKNIEVTPGPGHPPQIVPVDDSAYVIDEAAFQKAIGRNPSILRGWKGAISAGASLVEATQNSSTFTGSAAFVRAIPTEDWLDPRNRTTVDFSASYGKVTQPNTPVVKTAIYHADAERDEYFTSRVFAFGQLAYDHNFSQGLNLQQAYGGGVGWTILKSSNETLDLKGSLSYVNQQFAAPAQSLNLIGATVAERYARTFPHKVLLNEQLSVTPALNNAKAYSAAGSVGLTLPVYKRFSLATGIIDTFLNDPPPGFRKNSFQFTTGLTYTLP